MMDTNNNFYKLYNRNEMDVNCSENDFNTTEGIQSLTYPQPDIMESIKRGEIKKNFNSGLRNPQAKHLEVETYNGGCVNPWGCVSNNGHNCNSEKKRNVEVNEMYDYLNQSYLTGTFQSSLEYQPPLQMEGYKAGTINSVSGWKKDDDGSWMWQKK